MKKFLWGIVFAALLFTIGGVLIASGAEKQRLIGLLIDGYQENCTVIRNGKSLKTTPGMELYTGDIIIKEPDVKLLKLHFYPYASGEAEARNRLKLVFNPPRDETIFFDRFLELIGFEAERCEHKIKVAASRGGLVNKLIMNGDLFSVVPFDQATIFSAGEVRFQKYNGKEESVTIYGEDQAELAGLRLINHCATVLGAKMKPGHDYYWRFDQSGPYRRIRILAVDDERRIKQILDQISKSESSDADNKIKQALFLKAISDAHPDRIDLYWMSYEILRNLVVESNSLTEKNVKTLDLLFIEFGRREFNNGGEFVPGLF
jgi:hypothetical protein